MKTIKSSRILTVCISLLSIFFFSIFLFTSCTPDYSDDRDDQFTALESSIDQVLDKFAQSEKEKDGATHRELFLSESSGVNFVIKTPENTFISQLIRDQWIGFFESWDYDYFATYSTKEYYIGKGMVINTVDFQGVRNGVDDLSGKDLFAFVKTTSGWKIVGVSSSITLPGDRTDYSVVAPIATTPNVAIDRLVTGLNTQDQASYIEAFVNPNAPCFQFDTLFDATYSDEVHSATAFYDRLVNTISGVELQLIDTEIVEKDQFTAVVSGAYRILKDGKRYEKGQVLATVLASPETGWKVTNMLFSTF